MALEQLAPHHASRAADAAGDGARQAKDSRTLDGLVRGGLVAYGVVHLLVGWLAIQLALGDSQGSADNQGALHQLAQTPLGRPLLWLLVVGFVALVAWQAIDAAVGHTSEQDERKRLAQRAGSAGKAVAYAAIGFSAGKIAAGSGKSSGDSSGETFTAKLLGAPAGQVLVALVGLAIVGVGVYLVRKGWTEGFRKQLESEGTSGQLGRATVLVGKVGHIAKGAAFAVLGVLFVTAAVNHDPKDSGGIDDALKTLLGQPFGGVIVVAIGLGIAAFGLFCFARARHLRRA